ncbi:O-antigen ligase family protein [Polaromonas sp.]|uniref:O-antigen ligase family protein n=1 Tax=Polaromonas sp. TaxID=1869339 RepID=UPI002488F460|nr:O-antigen ligase family protein [Polaromonas sp.]MDI1273035.1 O-antigen ligase family protein [Polaromonas sp.]
MTTDRVSVRLITICTSAGSSGLSLVIISLAKISLLVTALVFLLRRGSRAEGYEEYVDPLRSLWTPRLVALILFVFAVSLLWTTATMAEALGAMGKYGKFLVIPALLVLVRTRRDASWILTTFLGAQIFLLAGSWLLFAGVQVPWATSNMAKASYSVFSSYLDQGIISAVVAAVFWHLKSLAPNRFLFCAAIALSLLALGAVYILFVGRTGHIVGVIVVSLAIFWALPGRYRLAAVIVPPLICVVAFFSFDKVSQRFSGVAAEVNTYATHPEAATSSGVRLRLWRTSLQAIGIKPWLGSGVGSWATEYQRIEFVNSSSAGRGVDTVRNPHQEFLLWGVQLGVGGIFLFFAFFIMTALDFLKMKRPIARAGLSVLAAFAASCLFNSSLYDAYIGDFFCLAIGVLLAFGFRESLNKSTDPACEPLICAKESKR